MLSVFLASPAVAADPDQDASIEIVVEADEPEDSATARSLDRDAIEAMPSRSADDLLRAMPGLHQSAHGGRGKAYQYFLRGFDAVHGADIAVSVEGVPVNEVSNVHGHGYLDLHFLPSALVEGVDLWPGAWRAEAGDFATAGSAEFHLGLAEPGGTVRLGGGTDRSGTATLTWRPDDAPSGTFVVADVEAGLGIGASRGWRQVRGGAGIEVDVGDAQVRAWALGYDGRFESPGVLRVDDLESGRVSFYDAYPGSGGGRSTRALGALQSYGGGARLAWKTAAYAGWRGLSLQQDFTGWYGDPIHGDGSLQEYTASTFGGYAETSWAPTTRLGVHTGLTGRLDVIEQAEQGVDMEGARWGPTEQLTARQGDLGAWLSVPAELTDWLTVEPGIRGELFLVLIDGRSPSWAVLPAPKLRATLFADEAVTGFLAYGRGFRSPDARGVGEGGRAPVSIADAFEVGATSEPTRWLGLRAAAFATLISNEIVFDHAAARYLTSGSTRRLGADGGVTIRPVEPIRLEADLTYADGRYVATGEPIPYAPRLLTVVGAYVEGLPVGGGKATGGVRGWLLGPRPIPGGFVSQTAAVVDLTAGLSWRRWSVEVDVDNVLGTRWRDGEFLFPSHWDLDSPRSELPARHLTAGAPFAARLAVERRF